MTDAPGDTNQAPLDLQRFRPYLRLLAGAAIGARWERKFDASDVVQETLLQAHRNQADLRGRADGEVAGWLRRALARNLNRAKRDLHRQRRDVRREVSLDAAIELSSQRLGAILPAGGSSPSSRVLREERSVLLAAMLESLAAAQREALVLTYLNGLSIQEAAERMGRTTVAVASLLRRGLARLRELAGGKQGD